MKKKISAFLGPTNTGKTYTAIQSLLKYKYNEAENNMNKEPGRKFGLIAVEANKEIQSIK